MALRGLSIGSLTLKLEFTRGKFTALAVGSVLVWKNDLHQKNRVSHRK